MRKYIDIQQFCTSVQSTTMQSWTRRIREIPSVWFLTWTLQCALCANWHQRAFKSQCRYRSSINCVLTIWKQHALSYGIPVRPRLASCVLRVACCVLRLACSSSLYKCTQICDLRVASCDLRVASCDLRVATCVSFFSLLLWTYGPISHCRQVASGVCTASAS